MQLEIGQLKAQCEKAERLITRLAARLTDLEEWAGSTAPSSGVAFVQRPVPDVVLIPRVTDQTRIDLRTLPPHIERSPLARPTQTGQLRSSFEPISRWGNDPSYVGPF